MSSDIEQGKKILAAFKQLLSPFLYSALEEPMALTLIANNQIDLQHIVSEKNCYTWSYLVNEFGLNCLSKQHITTQDFLAVPVHERYTLHYLFKDGAELLEKGITHLQTFLAVAEKKRLSYIDHLKQDSVKT